MARKRTTAESTMPPDSIEDAVVRAPPEGAPFTPVYWDHGAIIAWVVLDVHGVRRFRGNSLSMFDAGREAEVVIERLMGGDSC